MVNVLDLTTKDKTFIFDESGNLGKDGRYFVIACIETSNPKEIHNVMKRQLHIAKRKYSDVKFNGCELKSSKAPAGVKEHIVELICKKDISISYVVLDLENINQSLLNEKNLLYNYACKLLIDSLIDEELNEKKLNIWIDNHTVKVHSKNSFLEYIKLGILYERGIDTNISVQFVNSNATDAYVIQAADFIANAVYVYYERGKERCYNMIKSKLKKVLVYPNDTAQ